VFENLCEARFDRLVEIAVSISCRKAGRLLGKTIIDRRMGASPVVGSEKHEKTPLERLSAQADRAAESEKRVAEIKGFRDVINAECQGAGADLSRR
jgi:hypothetical protein